MILIGFILTDVSPDSLAAPIERGESFILSSLGDSLRLPVFRSVYPDSFLANGRLDTTDFGTSFFLNAARFSPSPEIRETAGRVAATLYARRLPGDLFKYYPHRENCEVDLDDVACISYELALFGYGLKNLSTFLAWRDSSGGFFTWASRKALPNDLDAEVNSNVARWLFRLGYGDERFLIFLDSQVRNPALYYCWSPLAFCYTMSRMMRDEPGGIPDSLREDWSTALISKTLALRPWGTPLNTALAANTLINLGYQGPEQDEAISALLSTQGDDGAWPAFAFYTKKSKSETYCFGSRELTTVIALEALYRYKAR